MFLERRKWAWVLLGGSLDRGKIPKPIAERRLSLACGSLSECAQYPAGGGRAGSGALTGLKSKQSLYLGAGATSGGEPEHMLNSSGDGKASEARMMARVGTGDRNEV